MDINFCVQDIFVQTVYSQLQLLTYNYDQLIGSLSPFTQHEYISIINLKVPNLTPVDPKWPWTPPNTIGFLYSMWVTYIPMMRSVQVSLLEISCLQSFHNFTSVDPKWPLTSTKNNRLLELNVVHLHTKYEICPSLPSWDIMVYKVFTIWSLLTSNDNWPPPKTIGFLCSMCYTYIPNMRSVQASLLEISCLQSFNNLTPVDPKWPLTSTKNNRLLVLIVVHLHTKYEICPSFPSLDIVFTRFSQFDPCWPPHDLWPPPKQ